MKKLVFIFLMINAVCSGQISIDTTSYMIYDSTTNTSTDWSQYLGMFDSIPSATIVFDTITKNDFVSYKKKYQSKIEIDSSKITWTDTSFTIKTENRSQTYNTLITDEFSWNYYKGFLKPLNFFLVQNIDGHNELGILMLIDKVTGKKYYLSSGYDYPCETAFISPKNNYLFSYANNWADDNQCALSILKIEKTNKHFKVKGFIGLEINTCTINDIAWINENSFALSVKEKIDLNDHETGSGIDHFLRASFAK